VVGVSHLVKVVEEVCPVKFETTKFCNNAKIVIKPFHLKLIQNKLDCLSLANISRHVQYLEAKAGRNIRLGTI
jgi:hypothetical protein